MNERGGETRRRSRRYLGEEFGRAEIDGRCSVIETPAKINVPSSRISPQFLASMSLPGEFIVGF